jgi:DNA-binding MarR family transcriptional regulator
MAVDDAVRAELVAEVVVALGRGASQYALLSQAVAAQLGIGPTDLDCLAVLQAVGPTSPGQLAEVLTLTTGAVTGILDRLAAAGFVVRDSDPDDRRRVIVTPVASRMAEVDQVYAPLREAAAAGLGAFTDQDLRTVLDFQRRMYVVLRRQAARARFDNGPGGGNVIFSAPLAEVRAGCLEFASGAYELRIYACEDPALLYQAVFEGTQQTVRAQSGNVVVRYKRMGPFEWMGTTQGRATKPAGSVALNTTIPWTINVQGGASGVTLEARDLELRELKVSGGANKVDMVLPTPRGTVAVCIGGGLSRVQIQRPGAVAAQLELRGGANRLVFDGQRFGAVGGQVRLASPGWELAVDRYAIEVTGGSSRLTVQEL